ncbi:MAG TPA: hypothetical protein VGE13_00970 [Candidatus Saccharimonadales bacterium]
MLCLGILVLAIVCMVYFGLRLSVRELQIATRFSDFGETQLYRNKWYYLLNFIGIIGLITVTHIALIGKLLVREMRSFAITLGWLTILMIVVGFLVTYAVFGVAYLT